MSKLDTGRTTRMIQSIPRNGAIVIVHNHGACEQIRYHMLDILGPELHKKCRIAYVTDPYHIMALRGLMQPVRVDHWFWETAHPGIADEVCCFERQQSRFEPQETGSKLTY